MNRMSNRGGPGAQMVIPGGPLGKARYALAIGRSDEAERIIRKRLEQNPNDVAARVLLSQSLLQNRQTQEATDEARKAVRAAPNNADAQMALAAALLQNARFSVPEEARTAAERAVQLAPKLARARVQLAEVYLADKKDSQAQITAEEAIKLEPRGSAGYFIKALALNSQKDYAAAAAAAESAIRYDRDHQLPQAEYIRATSLVELKRYDEALVAITSAEKGNPLLGGPQADTLRSRVYFRQRKYKDSYQASLAAQTKAGRNKYFAPPLAALNMVFTGLFGNNGQYVMLAVIMVVVFAILFGFSRIPVAGGWIVAVLVTAIALVMGLTSVRQFAGSILPERSLWAIVLPVMAAAFLIGGYAALWIQYGLGHIGGGTPEFWTPTTVGTAGVVGAVLLCLADWGVPKLLARYGGSTGRASRA
jgi:tetratricopeptide (TPR) repeat protein